MTMPLKNGSTCDIFSETNCQLPTKVLSIKSVNRRLQYYTIAVHSSQRSGLIVTTLFLKTTQQFWFLKNKTVFWQFRLLSSVTAWLFRKSKVMWRQDEVVFFFYYSGYSQTSLIRIRECIGYSFQKNAILPFKSKLKLFKKNADLPILINPVFHT